MPGLPRAPPVPALPRARPLQALPPIARANPAAAPAVVPPGRDANGFYLIATVTVRL